MSDENKNEPKVAHRFLPVGMVTFICGSCGADADFETEAGIRQILECAKWCNNPHLTYECCDDFEECEDCEACTACACTCENCEHCGVRQEHEPHNDGCPEEGTFYGVRSE